MTSFIKGCLSYCKKYWMSVRPSEGQMCGYSLVHKLHVPSVVGKDLEDGNERQEGRADERYKN